MKNHLLLLLGLISSVFLSGVIQAEEIIRYSERGDILGRFDCDEVAVHESSRQDTIVCSKKPKVALNVRLKRIYNNAEYANCNQDSRCVIIENKRDPNWSPIALVGIPDAFFGRSANGRSCARIQESVPNSTTWARDAWYICTNNPNIELAYTYALGHSNEGLDKRFKDVSAKRACFGDVLQGYANQRYWADNCIFVRRR